MKKHINENFLLDAMGTVLVGSVGLLGAYYGGIAGFEIAANAKDKLSRRYKEIKQNRLDKKLEPILDRFANDPAVQNMYKALPKYRDPFNAPTDEQALEQEKINKQYVEQAKEISDYIKSQLSPEELKYVKNITAGLLSKINETKQTPNKMQVEKLRSLIRESINEYIREIEEGGNIAALDAKELKCEEAIQLRQERLNKINENDDLKEMVDENKMKIIQNEIKLLEKAKKRYAAQKAKIQAKKDKKENPKKEEKVTTGTPIDEADVTAQMEMSDDEMKEEALNESFLKMQKLAGVITETQYNQKKKSLS